MMYKIEFKDGVNVSVDMETGNVIVNKMSKSDKRFNSIAEKAMEGSETEQIRLQNEINFRLREEAL